MADPVTARRGLMLILTSPSGAGKSTLTRQLLQVENEIALSVSVTTRPKRADEIDKVHYFFISPERFIQMRDAGELLEWAEVHGNYYATSRVWIEEQMRAVLRFQRPGAAVLVALRSGRRVVQQRAIHAVVSAGLLKRPALEDAAPGRPRIPAHCRAISVLAAVV